MSTQSLQFCHRKYAHFKGKLVRFELEMPLYSYCIHIIIIIITTIIAADMIGSSLLTIIITFNIYVFLQCKSFIIVFIRHLCQRAVILPARPCPANQPPVEHPPPKSLLIIYSSDPLLIDYHAVQWLPSTLKKVRSELGFRLTQSKSLANTVITSQ